MSEVVPFAIEVARLRPGGKGMADPLALCTEVMAEMLGPSRPPVPTAHREGLVGLVLSQVRRTHAAIEVAFQYLLACSSSELVGLPREFWELTAKSLTSGEASVLELPNPLLIPGNRTCRQLRTALRKMVETSQDKESNAATINLATAALALRLNAWKTLGPPTITETQRGRLLRRFLRARPWVANPLQVAAMFAVAYGLGGYRNTTPAAVAGITHSPSGSAWDLPWPHAQEMAPLRLTRKEVSTIQRLVATRHENVPSKADWATYLDARLKELALHGLPDPLRPETDITVAMCVFGPRSSTPPDWMRAMLLLHFNRLLRGNEDRVYEAAMSFGIGMWRKTHGQGWNGVWPNARNQLWAWLMLPSTECLNYMKNEIPELNDLLHREALAQQLPRKEFEDLISTDWAKKVFLSLLAPVVDHPPVFDVRVIDGQTGLAVGELLLPPRTKLLLTCLRETTLTKEGGDKHTGPREPVTAPAGAKIIISAGSGQQAGDIVVWQDCVHTLRLAAFKLQHSGVKAIPNATKQHLRDQTALLEKIVAYANRCDHATTQNLWAHGVDLAVEGPKGRSKLNAWGSTLPPDFSAAPERNRDLASILRPPDVSTEEVEALTKVILPFITTWARLLKDDPDRATAEARMNVLERLTATVQVVSAATVRIEGTVARWPCSCGNKNCFWKHHLHSCDTTAPKVSLWNVTASAIKGGRGRRVGKYFEPLLGQLLQSMIYQWLTSPVGTTPFPARLRHEEVEKFLCNTPGCTHSTLLTNLEIADEAGFARELAACERAVASSPKRVFWDALGAADQAALIRWLAQDADQETKSMTREALLPVLERFQNKSHDKHLYEQLLPKATLISELPSRVTQINRFVLHLLFDKHVPAARPALYTTKGGCPVCNMPFTVRKGDHTKRRFTQPAFLIDGSQTYVPDERYACSQCHNLYETHEAMCPCCDTKPPIKPTAVWRRAKER